MSAGKTVGMKMGKGVEKLKGLPSCRYRTTYGCRQSRRPFACQLLNLSTFSVLLLLMFAVCVHAFDRDTVTRIKSSTVYIEVKRKALLDGSESLSSGSGFFLSKHGHL